MISVTTFERTFRQHLLDIIYGQWFALGAPFAEPGQLDPHEVIDLEALLWCSLEFLPTEPRLAETVLEWFSRNEEYIIRQRISRRTNRTDPRALLWNVLDPRSFRLRPIELEPSSETSHGLDSAAQLVEFVQRIAAHRHGPRSRVTPHRLGQLRSGSATLLLRARDLIGQDIRHFLLVYLLANPHGGKLREVQEWSGYSYRSLSDAASRWAAADVATLDSGYCRLTAPEAWRTLLHIRNSRIIPVNWANVFEASVRLLRDVSKARARGLEEQSPVYSALKREAAIKLTSAHTQDAREHGSSVRYLLHTLPELT